MEKQPLEMKMALDDGHYNVRSVKRLMNQHHPDMSKLFLKFAHFFLYLKL